MTYECNANARDNPPYTINGMMTDEGLRYLEGIVSSPTILKSVATEWGRPDYTPRIHRKDKANISGK